MSKSELEKLKKRSYKIPDIDIVNFDYADIIQTSSCDDDECNQNNCPTNEGCPYHY